jgi:hypothetical protein
MLTAERGRPGGVPAPEASRETQRRQQSNRGAGVDSLAEVQTLIETSWSVATLDFAFPDTRDKRMDARVASCEAKGIGQIKLAAQL